MKEQKEHCVFFIFFAGHGMIARDVGTVLLCRDASDGLLDDSQVDGCMRVSYLQQRVSELVNTDVVFFCRAALVRGDDSKPKPLDFSALRNYSEWAPKGLSAEEQEKHCRRLTVTTCSDGEVASDSGMTMKLILDAMRKSLNSGAGLELGERFFEERVCPSFKANNILQHPKANGRSIELAPATPKRHTGWGEDPDREAGTRNTLEINGVEYGFRWCPAGAFIMGSPENEQDRDSDETPHRVSIEPGFWMLETPTTQQLWKSTMGNNPSFFKGDDLPVENVNRDDACEFLTILNEKFQYSGLKFQLPTEEEWEYACRAGTSDPYSFETALNGDKANCDGRFPYGTETEGPYLGHTSAVKSYQPNGWGLYDMHGNVDEWCSDAYAAYPGGAESLRRASETGTDYVVRGGSWDDSARFCRAASRGFNDSSCRGNFIGFRFKCFEY